MNEEELKQLADQLSNPTGEMGIEVGKQMNLNNRSMIESTIDALDITGPARVMEIGHGNGQHVGSLFEKYPQISYAGLERSSTMREESVSCNRDWMDAGKATFTLSSDHRFPFETSRFDVIFTVNTLYFWKDPVHMFHEIARVLRPGGKLFITYADRATIEQLPFTKYGFRSYGPQELMQLAAKAGLEEVGHTTADETVIAKDGQSVERTFIISEFRKF